MTSRIRVVRAAMYAYQTIGSAIGIAPSPAIRPDSVYGYSDL